MSVNELIDILIQTSEIKYNLISEVYEITKAQSACINNSNTDYLLENIEKKQQKINEINDIDKKFYSAYINVKEKLKIESIESIDTQKYPNIKDLKKNVSNILRVTKNIDDLDRINNQSVKKEFDKVKEEMNNIKKEHKDLNKNIKAYKGYNTRYNHTQGVFMDYRK
jgi:chromosome segregation ATPase